MNGRDARRFRDSLDPNVRLEAERALADAQRRRERHAESRKRRRARVEASTDETAAIREVVFARAAGRCELCRKPLGEDGHLCHLEGGIGKKRQDQRVDNCVAGHAPCHRSIDKSPLSWLPEVKAWAARHGYPVPKRFLKLEALHQVQLPKRNSSPDGKDAP